MTCVSCEPKSRTAMVCGMSGGGKGRAEAAARGAASAEWAREGAAKSAKNRKSNFNGTKEGIPLI